MSDLIDSIFNSDDRWGVLLLDVSNVLTHLIALPCYRMHLFCGLGALIFFLTPIMAGLYLYYKAPLSFV